MRISSNNQEMIDFLSRIVGYTLTGDTGERCFFVFWGTGANGDNPGVYRDQNFLNAFVGGLWLGKTEGYSAWFSSSQSIEIFLPSNCVERALGTRGIVNRRVFAEHLV